MANKKKKRVERKSKEQKRRERYLLFMVLLVAFTMLFSGFYFFSSPGERVPTRPTREEEEPYFQSYDINPVGSNISILVTADEIKPELIAIVRSSCVNFQNIGWVYNISMPGLKDVICEVAGPMRGRYHDLCGRNLLFFKFTFENINENVTEKLRSELDNRLDEYSLKRAYIGILPVNLSGPGTDRVYIPGHLDVRKGDYARVLLFQKSIDGSLFGLERKRIPIGPVVSADVVNLTDIMVQGTIASDFYPNTIERDINVTSIRLQPPKILINETITNETIEEISKLNGVDTEIKDNKTEISFNSSLKDIMEILNREKLEYSLEEGSVLLRIPLNSSVELVTEILKENGIGELKFKKSGSVEIPDEVMINGKPVMIKDYDRFAAILDMETNVGDRINITISTLQFGDQIFVIGGAQEG
ncbi:MAG TPA: hypothetical protein ENF58_00365 [Candidatus Altiarchaeales archaeon]|nr:hypothetical protein [Candidatus Altiarchaeales archaeon]